MFVQVSTESMEVREGFGSPGARVTGGCQLLDMIAGNQTGLSAQCILYHINTTCWALLLPLF